MAEYFYQPPDVPLVILYRDDDLVVVDKPSGLLSVPGKTPEKADCLITSYSGHARVPISTSA